MMGKTRRLVVALAVISILVIPALGVAEAQTSQEREVDSSEQADRPGPEQAPANSVVSSAAEVVQDGGFEAGTPNPVWSEASTNFGTPLCSEAGCGSGGGSGARSGSWWAWFGGTTLAETGSVSQLIDIPEGDSAQLSFWLEIPASDAIGYLAVNLVDFEIFRVTHSDAASYPTYQKVVVDVSDFMGLSGSLEFVSQTQASSGSTNFFVDDVSLTVRSGSPPADFDGDADTDRSIFRSNGGWYVKDQPTVFHGLPGDIPVPADYDGDGDVDKAVYRNGAWYIKDQTTQFHGLASDIPVPADYDGDGDADVAVFRPSNGGWFVKNQATVFLGNSTDVPVPGDYDGDGDSERAVYRPSTGAWFVHGQTTVFFGGISSDIPVPGDYDGDGDTDRAVYRNGGWYVNGQTTQFFGLSGDKPMPGDYDGDGDIDRAVYRNGAWHVKDQPPVVYFGLAADQPLPLPHAIYDRYF